MPAPDRVFWLRKRKTTQWKRMFLTVMTISVNDPHDGKPVVSSRNEAARHAVRNRFTFLRAALTDLAPLAFGIRRGVW